MKLMIDHNVEYDQWAVFDLDQSPDADGRRLILAEFGTEKDAMQWIKKQYPHLRERRMRERL